MSGGGGERENWTRIVRKEGIREANLKDLENFYFSKVENRKRERQSERE